MRNGTRIRTALQVGMVLFLAGAVLRGQDPQEPAPAKPPTEATASQPSKAEAEPKTEVSVQDTGNTFKLRVSLVQVHVIVRGNAGKPLEGLRKEDFQLFDNGKLQPITTFAVENGQSRKERTEAAGKTQQSAGGKCWWQFGDTTGTLRRADLR
jgi:hypothetical protein